MKQASFTQQARYLLDSCGPLTGDAARLAHFLSQAVDQLDRISGIVNSPVEAVSAFQDVEISATVRGLWYGGDKIGAIKRFRDENGTSLLTTKNYLEKKLT